jgi:PAS domain S-box-containing protein
VHWRIGDSDRAILVDLAATPRFGPRHDFLGFRGFGICRPEVVSEWSGATAPAGGAAAEAAESASPSVAAEEATAVASPSLAEPGEAPPLDAAAEGRRGEAGDSDTGLEEPQPEPRAFQHLSAEERAAFREIARALGARFEEHQDRPDPGRPTAQIVRVRTREPVPPQTLEVLDRLPIGIVVHRGETVLFASRTLLDMVGYDSAASLAKDGGISRLFPGRPRSASPRDGGRAPLLLSTRRKGMLPVEALLTTVDWEGLPASALILRELAEVDTPQRLRAMELDLRAREARLQELTAILDTAVDGVIVLDESARILSLNRSAEALFGYDQKEVAGESVTILLAEESHSFLRHYLDGLRGDAVTKLLNDGREVVGRVRQGGTIPLFMTIARTSEAPRQFCAVIRDLTASKKAEAELSVVRRSAEAANGQKSEFLNKVSHEVRTPLNAIIGFAEVMLEERFGRIGNDRYKEYLKNIHECGRHVVSLVNDLLDLAKIEAGRMELSFGGVALNDIVAGCVNAMLQQANRDRIVVRTSFAPNLPLVVADERSMRQIVLNLIANAVKFTKAGGQVIVSTALTDRGEVAVRVRDTGVGMSEAEIEGALQPFRQISTAPRGGGTGLGLALARSLIEANRATLHITSAPDEGTFVEVLFPPTRVLTAKT